MGRVFTGDPELLKVTSTVMILMAGYIGCDGLQTVLGGILRGTGRQASAVPVIFFSYYLLALPAAFLFAFVFHWGVSALVKLATVPYLTGAGEVSEALS